MEIAVIGTGYIGLVSGVCLAHIGHTVTCIDHDAAKVASLKNGDVSIYEPGLSEMMLECSAAGKLHFSNDTVQAIQDCEAIFIAVGTPTASDGASSDLSYIFKVAEQIAASLVDFKVIIVKSTVPVGTGRRIENVIRKMAPHAAFEMVSNPEFLREGSAIFDFMNPDRIVVGSQTQRGFDVLNRIYAPFIEKNTATVYTDLESAELIKFASNGFLATKIAFINEMAFLCEKSNANIRDVARGMGLDDRIGAKFLKPGPGFGGSCFPKDTRALAAMARDVGVHLRITDAVVESNEQVKQRMADQILSLAGSHLENKVLVVLGVTFKPDTDDMREAPSLDILPPLSAKGAVLRIVDPQGRKHGERVFPGVYWFEDPYEASRGADMIVVLTEWQQFRNLNLAQLRSGMRGSIMADLRNVYDQKALSEAGFTTIWQIGTPPIR